MFVTRVCARAFFFIFNFSFLFSQNGHRKREWLVWISLHAVS